MWFSCMGERGRVCDGREDVGFKMLCASFEDVVKDLL